jgi:ribonucleoside-diphosphate reductase beta chain
MLTDYAKTFKPFNYPDLMEIAKKHELIHWHEDEIDLGDDIDQWNKGDLSEQETNQITQILRLFTQTDVQVGQNYCDLFIPIFKNNEARCMLLAFASREGIHQRAYALLNDTLGLPDDDYKAFLDYEEMANKIEFMQENDVSTKEGIGLALAQTVCNEGMSLFSAFVMLLNYQRYGKMLGMCKITEWSLRDESQHVNGMAKLFTQYCKENKEIVTDAFKKKIYKMYRNAVGLEDKFIDLVFEMGGCEGLTKEEVKEYIKYIADRRLTQLGMKPNFGVEANPLPWLDWVLTEGHTNFFEQRVSEYSVAGLKGSWGW